MSLVKQRPKEVFNTIMLNVQTSSNLCSTYCENKNCFEAFISLSYRTPVNIIKTTCDTAWDEIVECSASLYKMSVFDEDEGKYVFAGKLSQLINLYGSNVHNCIKIFCDPEITNFCKIDLISPLKGGAPRKGGKKAKEKNKPKNKQRSNKTSSSGTVAQKKSPGHRVHNGNHIAKHHARSMMDPFHYAPVRLGIGTFEPTEMFSTYLQATASCNADGTGFISVMPARILDASTSGTDRAINFVCYNTAAVASAASLFGYAANNQASLANSYGQFRILSAQLLVKPLLAETAAPGLLSGDILRPNGSTVATTHSTATLTAYAGMRYVPTSSNSSGYVLTLTPEDLDDFEFKTSAQRLASRDALGANLVVTLSGFPPSTAYLFEVIVHCEGFPAQTNTTTVQVQPGIQGPYGPEAGAVTLNENVHNTDSFFANLMDFGSEIFNGLTTVEKASDLLMLL